MFVSGIDTANDNRVSYDSVIVIRIVSLSMLTKDYVIPKIQ